MTYQLYSSMVVSAERAEVFAFFADAANLEVITPPELRFRILSPQPITMRTGALIDYTIRLWGVPLRWRTRIALWSPGSGFVDVQERGPYRSWVHIHRFTQVSGGTLVEDEVVYTLPFGRLGRLVAPLVRRQLERIFSYRRDRIREVFAHSAAGVQKPGQLINRHGNARNDRISRMLRTTRPARSS